MRLIDMLNMMAKNENEEGTKLKHGYKIYDYINDYTESDDCSFVNKENDGTNLLEDDELITKSFLNSEVELIPPESNKYQLKLYKDDNLSYVTRSYCEKVFNYDLGSKTEVSEFITKFTQDEIDDDKFLKFVEMHGIKEEVEENETN